MYLRLFHSSVASKQRKLKTEILSTKAEMLQTSAQDQFAKWAKLRRSMDKGLADLDKLSKSPIVFIICHFLPSRAAFVNVYS